MSDWTTEQLKEHINALLAEREKRQDQRVNDLWTAVNSNADESRRSLEARLSSQKDAVDAAMRAATIAVNKAEAAAEKRFEGVNEFRNTLADQQRTLMPRAEAEVRLAGVEARMTELSKRLERFDGQKSGVHAGWGWAVGVVGFVLVILTLMGTAMVLVEKMKP